VRELAIVMSDNQKSLTASTGIDIIFEGPKSYWKARVTLEIILVHHTHQQCLEVIVFHPDKNIEAPRIYINTSIVLGKLDKAELQKKVASKKETLTRSKKPFNQTMLMKEVTKDILVNFVFPRLQLGVGVEFTMVLVPQTGDMVADAETNRIEEQYASKPDSVLLHSAIFSKKVTNTDILAALGQYQDEAVALRRATRAAELATSSVDGFKLILAERKKWKLLAPARLRWIKAINRVLIQQYVEKVRIRVDALYSKPISIENDDDDVIYGRKLVKPVVPPPRRPRILRRSVDNSSCAISAKGSLPAITEHFPSNKGIQKSSSRDPQDTTLPAINLSPASQGQSQAFNGSPYKHRARSQEYTAITIRRSFDGTSIYSPIEGNVPSLLQSYNRMSAKLVPPLSEHAVEISTHFVRQPTK
jgi:hypothetical protein